ncbi:MAG: DNA repair ATPase [bacterium]|nr:DNA repair ATPase [bacterium]
MAENEENINQQQEQSVELEAGTYEVLRNRLKQNGADLLNTVNQLNSARKEVFGTIETELVHTDRITTANNCVPWDMVPIGSNFIFGYNVHMGLKVETNLEDVFSIYKFENNAFHEQPLDLLKGKTFEADFKQLYKYYKDTVFVKFAKIGPHLHMVFRIGKEVTDIKTFKWQINGDKLKYIDNRSAHEFIFPEQHQFRWKRTSREHHREGKHPHISVEDQVFVETVGGDLTIKIEDNTDDGKGIYREPVEHQEQTLTDSEIQYTIIGNLIILKIRPYQEDYRYLVFNSKLEKVQRIDALSESCILLPDDHGIIFSNGYYLQNGEFKQFDNDLSNMIFEKRIDAPNGEDYLYVFYNRLEGIYLLLNYNLINQSVESPLMCHGFSIFDDGTMCLFRGDKDPKKHHVVQIWKTPFTNSDFEQPTKNTSLISKIGNKEIVRAMAECHEVLNYINRDEVFSSLYIDLIKMTSDILDSYHWLNKEEVFTISSPLQAVKETASSTVDEFEKVTRIKKDTAEKLEETGAKADEVIKNVKKLHAKDINDYVAILNELRIARGEVISLKELRYIDLDRVEKYDALLAEYADDISKRCVNFLLRDNSLKPYIDRVDNLSKSIEEIKKVKAADETSEQIDTVSEDLKMLIDTVSNLAIDDATETTRIIDEISNIYSEINKVKAELRKKRKSLRSSEGKAEFNAQLKLVDQAVINFLDLCDTPEKCEEYLTKLMVQLEELEGRFSEFDEFIAKIAEKRDDVYNAFESKRVNLLEARNKRAAVLQQSGERIIKSIKSRISRFESVNEINGYMASDLMIEKLRKIVEDLNEIGDTVKAEDLNSKLKTTREDALRQLKDRSELYADGDHLIKFGTYQFAVNTQNLDLTIVPRNGEMYYHLTGTDFFEIIRNENFERTKPVWNQDLISENNEVYRSEYLAYSIISKARAKENRLLEKGDFEFLTTKELYELDEKGLLDYVQRFMALRYNEGYLKGVHDFDASQILATLLDLLQTADLLRYSSISRAFGALFWKVFVTEEQKLVLDNQIKGAGLILNIFPDTREFSNILEDIKIELSSFLERHPLFEAELVDETAYYLFYELARGNQFIIDKETAAFETAFKEELNKSKATKKFKDSIKELAEHPELEYRLIRKWLNAFIDQHSKEQWREYVDECAILLMMGDSNPNRIVHTNLKVSIDNLRGDHVLIDNGSYHLDYNHFMIKLNHFQNHTVQLYNQFLELKKTLAADFADDLRLSEFRPRILSSFVRNQLINEVYLPLIGSNLAKQIGTAGEQKRTDLNGLLLLISPPGYGKTTLMEYIANRLGIIFMKINGPALGHSIISLDPGEAPNATSKEELEKLNLAFEMGDNVMIYLDDIQHCNPELLQKFISLCDAQRKIEGVYKGKTKTYDFRGKKVCVVMAGNPYTESGEKFQIPDMLANRADIYNLGDIIGDTDDVFNMSYIENSLTSNPVLAKVAGKSHKDVLKFVEIAETGKQEGIEFEASHSPEELSEAVEILKKVIVVRNIITNVNQLYIKSAAQSDEYRTEPSFKLQGSYRDMNKISEKIVSVMNDEELDTLIMSHYENESQTLTSGAESNLLRFKQLIGKMNDQETERWSSIVETFQKQQKMKGYGQDSQVGLVIEQMEAISQGLNGIKEEILDKMRVYSVASRTKTQRKKNDTK